MRTDALFILALVTWQYAQISRHSRMARVSISTLLLFIYLLSLSTCTLADDKIGNIHTIIAIYIYQFLVHNLSANYGSSSTVRLPFSGLGVSFQKTKGWHDLMINCYILFYLLKYNFIHGIYRPNVKPSVFPHNIFLGELLV